MSRKNVVTLSEQLEEGSLTAPYIMDCLTGRMAENTGFRTFIVDARSVAVGCGYDDPAMVSRDELLGVVSRTADFFPYPIIADLGAGYADTAENLKSVIPLFAFAGAAAVIVDDTVPMGRGILEALEFYRKIQAAIQVCRQRGLLLIAASDAEPDQVGERLKVCADLGADLVMSRRAEGTKQQLAAAAGITCGKMAQDLSGDRTALENAGYRIFAVRYVEKASFWGIMELGRKCRVENSTVSVDYHTFDGMLPDMDHHHLLSDQWNVLSRKLSDLSMLDDQKPENGDRGGEEA